MTPHIEAKEGSIAKTVIMPGDPLRAKFIAEHYLEHYELVSAVRGILAYTGYYKGKRITVMASGMGMPSMGIYSYELYRFYDVDYIIRVGTAGAYTDSLALYDVILTDISYSDSSYAFVQNGTKTKYMKASESLNQCIKKTAEETNKQLHVHHIYCTDVFYKEQDNFQALYQEYQCVACDMESFALFHNANLFDKKAACLLTVSNNLVTNEETTSEERQNAFTQMLELALDTVTKL